MGIPLQGFSDLDSRPASGQEPDGVPAFTLPWCWSTVHLVSHGLEIHLPLAEHCRYILHRRAPPHWSIAGSIPYLLCGFHFGFSLGWAGYVEAVVFMAVLFLALVYLWRVGALDWGPGAPRHQDGGRTGEAE